MVINANFPDLSSPDLPVDLKRAINHETYHHFQTVCTGFAWRRADAVRRIVVARIGDGVWRRLMREVGVGVISDLLRILPGGTRRRIGAPLLERMIGMISAKNELADLSRRADPNDPSLAAAESPGLFANLDALEADLWAPRTGGLADGHLLEGGAVAHGVMVEAIARCGPGALAPENAEALDAEIADRARPLGPQYSTLLDVARLRCAGPASPFLLPAAALALHYELPAAAFLPLLDALRAPGPLGVMARSRELQARPLEIPAAGRALGSARAAAGWRRRRWPLQPWRRNTDGIHQIAFAELDTERADELTVLCDPAAFGEIPGGIVASVFRFNDRVQGVGGVSNAEAAVRIALAGIVLRAHTRRSRERKLEYDLMAQVQDMMNNTSV